MYIMEVCMSKDKISLEEKEFVDEVIKLVRKGNFIRGNLVIMKRTCGNPNCKCARGEKHKSLYLHCVKNGKQKMIYIPKSWEEKMQEWVARYHKIKDLIEKISEMNKSKLVNRNK